MHMYELMGLLPEDEFLTVRRGTIVRKTGIVSISDDGIYTMTDGSTFQRVKRFLNQHKVMWEKLGLNTSRGQTDTTSDLPKKPLTLLEKYSVLDAMLVAYADVVLNGVQCTLHDYSPEVDKTLTIHCYQPEPGFCACVLTEDDRT